MKEHDKRNLITDVSGIKVGNASDFDALTGVTVVLPDQRSVGAVDVRGGAPGTRETEALSPSTLVDRVDAIVLSGGSAFGLDAASGVTEWLAKAGKGFAVGKIRVPVVPSAILFDLSVKEGQLTKIGYHALGVKACTRADHHFDLGNYGAGTGAVAGNIKGGLGSASTIFENGIEVGALVAVNSAGSVTIPGTESLWSWSVEEDGEFGGMGPPRNHPDWNIKNTKLPLLPNANTTIGVVATNATLTPAQLQRVVLMAQDGIARAIRPAHSPFDGDTLFALATCRDFMDVDTHLLSDIGEAAAACVERSVGRAVYEAVAVENIPSLRLKKN